MKNLLSLIRLAIFACIFTSCNHASNTTSSTSPSPETVRPKTPEELRQELKQTEQNNPTTYVHSFGETLTPNQVQTREAGLFRDAQYEIQGYWLKVSLKNSASVATFKDAIIKVSYISETNTVISTEQIPIYQILSPNGVIYYQNKVSPPADMKSFNVQVVGATPVNQ
jgi:hypothetical protein